MLSSDILSNFIFGQGPWTPWQMFAFGLIGFISGMLFHSDRHPPKMLPLCVFGGFATFIIYGLIADTSAIMLFTSELTKENVLLTYSLGIPFNAIHAAATVIFLMILARPMIEKLTRVKTKYGLMIG